MATDEFNWLDPLSAMEIAVTQFIIDGGLKYTEKNCARMINGQPAPRCGMVFVSVWSPGDVAAGNASTGDPRAAFQESMRVNVTVTRRLEGPWDRWVKHRDELKGRCRQIAKLVQRDVIDYSVTNIAKAMLGEAVSYGWIEPLTYLGTDAAQIQGPQWFNAVIDTEGQVDIRDNGVSMTVRFGNGLRIEYAQGND